MITMNGELESFLSLGENGIQEVYDAVLLKEEKLEEDQLERLKGVFNNIEEILDYKKKLFNELEDLVLEWDELVKKGDVTEDMKIMKLVQWIEGTIIT